MASSPTSRPPEGGIAPPVSINFKLEIPKVINFLGEGKATNKDILDQLNKLVEFSEFIPDLSEIIPLDDFIKCLRPLVVTSSKTVRTAALRVLRYYTNSHPDPRKWVTALLNNHMDRFIARSLEREKICEAERLQALKLFRALFLPTSNNESKRSIKEDFTPTKVPVGLVQSLVSIADSPDDNFARVATEALTEILIRYPKEATRCNGVKVIINAILNPSFQGIQESLVLSLIYMLNDQSSRQYIRPSLDIGMLLAPLTETISAKELSVNPIPAERERRWTTCIKAIVIMLKSWTGFIALATHPLGLKSLVAALTLPAPELHDKILDALFDIFRLGVAKNSNPFKFNAQPSHSEEPTVSESGGLDLPSRTRGERHNLLLNYLSALLIAFIDAGFIDALVHLGTNAKFDDPKGNSEISTKSTLLLGELLYLSNTHLPSGQCAKVQTLPSLMEFAASFSQNPRLRSKAWSMVSHLHLYHHLKHTSSTYDFHLNLIVTGANKWKRLKGRDRKLDRMDDVKLKLDWTMDVDQLKLRIQESQVVANKNYQNWKWEVISDLLEGPLNNPQLLIQACKLKFVKRILSFLRPSGAFSKMPWNAQNLKYVRMACQLLEILANNDTGRDCLLESRLIPEIGQLLQLEVSPNPNLSSSSTDLKSDATGDKGATYQSSNSSDSRLGLYGSIRLDSPIMGLSGPKTPPPQRLLSPDKLLRQMAREYFTMLGTLSSSPKGMEILTKFKIFQSLIQLSELEKREDLCHLIMTSLDYNMPGDSRVILEKALTADTMVLRYLATRHMRVLLRAGVQDFSDWGVDLLVKQLPDKDMKVANIALNILDEACDDVESLDNLIAKKPQLLKMGEAGRNLWLRFLSRPNGFKYLEELGFIEKEMKEWKIRKNTEYVIHLESALAESFSPSLYKQRESEQNDGVFLPPHFYGELAKTEEGCRTLEKSGEISEMVLNLNDENSPGIIRRSALWTVGNVGSSPSGFKFLEKFQIVEKLIFLVENSPSLSIRGTCFYVLGMLSKIEKAREILTNLGWDCPTSLNSFVCLPQDLHKSQFLRIPKYEFLGSPAEPINLPDYPTAVGKEIIGAVHLLCNAISAESASRTIKRLKIQHPEEFHNPILLAFVFRCLETYKFRLNVRRFIYDMLDGVILSSQALTAFDSATKGILEPSIVIDKI